jgi:hypothetical protein
MGLETFDPLRPEPPKPAPAPDARPAGAMGLETFDPLRPGESTKPGTEAPPAERPDWLVGAEFGLDAKDYQGREITAAEPTRLRRLGPDAPPAKKFVPPPPEEGLVKPLPRELPDQDPAIEPTSVSASSAPARVPEPTAEPADATSPTPPFLSWEESPKPRAPRWQISPSADEEEEKVARKSVLLELVVRHGRDRRVQIGAAIVAVIVFVISMLSWMEPAFQLSRVRRQPERYDGQVVTVRGRVGEVFPVGGSYAFNLLQGRDTLVVFTRSRVPVFRQTVTVTGSVSTGYLEGSPRAAVFEGD